MQELAHLLSENFLLLLFLVSGIGYLIGKIRIKGFSLGIAAVLFVGLAFGALGPNVELPEFSISLGWCCLSTRLVYRVDRVFSRS
jgi:putative transport protein